MAESKVRNESYYQVSGWMLNRLQLKGIELDVYAIIYGFTQDGESSFTGSLQYLSDFTNATRPTVIKALKSLVEKGYIVKHESQVNGVKFNTYKANLPVVKNLYQGGKESLPGGSKETLPGGGKEIAPGGGKETLPNNKSLDNKGFDNKGDKKRSPRTPDTEMPETQNLFTPGLQDAFNDWLQYKQERNETYTPTGLKSLITEIHNNVAEYGEAAVTAEIRKSMSSGWRGIIFERLKEARQRRGGQPRRQEPTPAWMNKPQTEENHLERYRKLLAQMRGEPDQDDSALAMRLVEEMQTGEPEPATIGNDPALAARAENLRQKLGQT